MLKNVLHGGKKKALKRPSPSFWCLWSDVRCAARILYVQEIALLETYWVEIAKKMRAVYADLTAASCFDPTELLDASVRLVRRC